MNIIDLFLNWLKWSNIVKLYTHINWGGKKWDKLFFLKATNENVSGWDVHCVYWNLTFSTPFSRSKKESGLNREQYNTQLHFTVQFMWFIVNCKLACWWCVPVPGSQTSNSHYCNRLLTVHVLTFITRILQSSLLTSTEFTNRFLKLKNKLTIPWTFLSTANTGFSNLILS